MDIDYRALCIDLFGTDDVKELEKIAKKANDNRGAGRKNKLNKKQIKEIEILLEKGMTLTEIARIYGTSRQIIDKYINTPIESDYTLRMTYMHGRKPCTIIDVDFINERIRIKNRTDDILHRAFGVIEEPTWEHFEEFLADRSFPQSRGNAKAILKDMNIDSYDKLQIVEKTKGRTADDNLWIKFKYYSRVGEIGAEN